VAHIARGNRESPQRQASAGPGQAFDGSTETCPLGAEPLVRGGPEIVGDGADIVRRSGHTQLVQSYDERIEAIQQAVQARSTQPIMSPVSEQEMSAGGVAPPDPMTGGADPRIIQANERTLLAWMRTGIALMTFGFVIARIGVWLRALAASQSAPELHSFGTAWIGAAFVGLGVLANAVATLRYSRNHRAILAGQPLPDDRSPLVLAVVVTVLGAVMGTYLLLRLV
jgi:putative membrane protein